jgi:hypothetical protein
MAPTLERKLQLGLMIPIISSGKCRPWHLLHGKAKNAVFASLHFQSLAVI